MDDVNDKDIRTLLDRIRADFPRRQQSAERLMADLGIDETLSLEIAAPEQVSRLPSFDSQTHHIISPMLAARFGYAGMYKTGQSIWLSPSQMQVQMIADEVRSVHRSLREHWEGSAPAVFPDSQLTLFGITEGVPESLTYLIWREGQMEPDVCVYSGLNQHRFANLSEYLTWVLTRE